MTAGSKDLAVTILVTLLGVAVWIESGTWMQARNLAQDPSILPRSLAVLLWLVAASMVVRLVRASESVPTRRASNPAVTEAAAASMADGVPELSGTDLLRGGDEEDEADIDGSLLLGVFAIVAISLYVWLAFRIGWQVTSWLFIVSSVLLLGRGRLTTRRVLAVAVVGALPVLILAFAFFELLNVRSPNTLLP